MKNINKKGISLIVLIVTIIVVIILAAVVILTLSKNNPIESAKEARFKEDIRTFQDELALYISKQYANAGGHWDGNISAKTCDEIKNYIPSFTKKYEGKFVINNNNLEYTNKLDEKEKEYLQSLNVREKVKLLPDEFQQVEYIESTGEQYLDTKFIANHNTGFYIEYVIYNQIINNSSVTGYLIGCRTRNSSNIQINRYQLSTWKDYNGGMLSFDSFSIDNSYDPKIIPGQKQSILLKNKILTKADGSHENLKNHIFSCDGSLFLLCCKEIKNNYTEIVVQEFAKAKIFEVIIYDGNLKVRHFIPCYSTISVSDVDGKECPKDTKGLYDLVDGKFYTNQGKGEFIAGPDVNE